jgi:hypothetical protein
MSRSIGTPSSFLRVAPPMPDPSPCPFFFLSKAADALRLSLPFRGRVRHRSSPAPLPPLSAKPVHRSRAPKCRCPYRICAEAPLSFPSSVISASSPSHPNWLSPNNCIPSPSRRTSLGSPPSTTSTSGIDVCNRPPELRTLAVGTPLG